MRITGGHQGFLLLNVHFRLIRFGRDPRFIVGR